MGRHLLLAFVANPAAISRVILSSKLTTAIYTDYRKWDKKSINISKSDIQTIKAETLQAVREIAIIQSAESSKRSEGVTVDRNRLLPLLAAKTSLRNRSEEEVFGYRCALDWIHEKHESIDVNEETILHLHYLVQSGFSGDAGNWKKKNNEIIELLPDGTCAVRFIPVIPEDVPAVYAD